MEGNRPKIVVIAGPTASGKSALALEVCRRFNGEVIAADSRTVYRGMDIGTAKPEIDAGSGPKAPVFGDNELSTDDRPDDIRMLFPGGRPMLVEGVPHWGFDLVDPDEDYSVSDFKRYADERIKDMVKRGKLPVIVGGTGLWVRALVDNLSLAETPPDPALRAELEARSLDDLFAEYKRLDPDGAEMIDRDNKRRVVRALEVTKKTGKPFSQNLIPQTPRYDALQIGLSIEKDELDRRIDERVDVMIAKGLFDEVRGLSRRYERNATALTGIGYREILDFLEGKAKAGEAVDAVKLHTRQYAKRQMTWFKKDPRIVWIEEPKAAMPLIEAFL